MVASSVTDVAVGFEWKPFSHGYVIWEEPSRETGHLAMNREKLNGGEWANFGGRGCEFLPV